MKDNEIKKIAEELKGEIEQQYIREYMEDGYSNIESIMEYQVQEYEEEHEIELSDEDYEKFLVYFNSVIDLNDIIESIKESEYIRKNGMLSYLGMNERDFI